MKKILLLTVVFFALIQAIQTDKTAQKVDVNLEVEASGEVMDILEKSCYDCHSQKTKWPTYSYIAPISWVVSSNVKNGRKALDFSKWANIDKKIKIERIERMKKLINNSMMPKSGYLVFHPEAELNKDKIKILENWIVTELKK